MANRERKERTSHKKNEVVFKQLVLIKEEIITADIWLILLTEIKKMMKKFALQKKQINT